MESRDRPQNKGSGMAFSAKDVRATDQIISYLCTFAKQPGL
jgi:hypothetical protein